MHRSFVSTALTLTAVVGIVALVAACSSNTPTSTGGESITLTLHPAAAAVALGGSVPLTGVLTRNSFSGDVSISADGVPSGVTYAVTRPATNGSDSATVTLTVGSAATVGGPYTIHVHASGSGVTTVTQAFALTITSGGVDTIVLPRRQRDDSAVQR